MEYPFQRIWLIQANWPRDGNLDLDAYAVKLWMDEHLQVLKEKQIDGIIIGLYQRKDI